MSQQCFYRASDGADGIVGPLSPREMRERADQGIILPGSPVRLGESGRWVAAWQVEWLFHGPRPLPSIELPEPQSLVGRHGAEHPDEEIDAAALEKLSDKLPRARRSYADRLNVASRASAQPRGIGGLLLIPAAGLILSPALVVAGIVLLATAGAGTLVVFHLLYLVFLVYVATQFFQKKAGVPGLMGLLLMLNLFLAMFTMADLGTEAGRQGLVHATVLAAVWIPYFLCSKRVRNTFVS